MYPRYCSSAGVVLSLERGVPCQRFGGGACHTGYAGNAPGRAFTGEMLFEDGTVVILFLVFDSKYFTVLLFTWWEIAIISLILCVIGMCGDLSASVLKRNFGVKDYGKLFPGHGGVMDRFDSALFVLGALYAIIIIYSRIKLA